MEEPTILGAIKFEDADSTVFLPVEGVTPEDVQEGMKVHVQWKKDPKGELADIQCVTPLLP